MDVITADQAREILSPPTISVVNAGRVLGMSRSVAYDALARGDIPHIRTGRRIRVLTAPLRRKLGMES